MSSGISFKLSDPVTIPLPSSGKATLFIDSTTGEPSFKDDGGVVESLKGSQGEAGVGVPSGGNTNQVLAKASGTDYDTEWVNPSGGGTWGSITGTLSNQTDLQNALDAKEGTVSAGTSSQYYRGDKSWQTLDKTAVGLSNVDNTSDANKPISTATQNALDDKLDSADLEWGNIGGTLSDQTDLKNALDAKEDAITAGTSGQYWRGDKSWQTLDKASVGLGNVDNTSDTNKPISSATQSALDDKADTSSLGSAAFEDVPTSGNATSGQVVMGNDTRLSDARTPTAHTHSAGDINAGTLDDARLPTVPVSKGGTGLTALGTAGQVMRVNSGATGLEWHTPSSGGGTWGSITGTLSDQTDLQGALNGKANLTGGNSWSGNQDFGSSSTILSGSGVFDNELEVGGHLMVTSYANVAGDLRVAGSICSFHTDEDKLTFSGGDTLTYSTTYGTDATIVTDKFQGSGELLTDLDADNISSGTVAEARLPNNINATKIANGTVDNTEFQYLNGVTSAIQTQINGKANTSHTHNASDITAGTLPVARGGTGLTSLGTANQVLAVNGAGTALEFQTVSGGGGGGTWGGITGTLSDQTDLQSALNGKANSSHTHTLSQITDVSNLVNAINGKGSLATNNTWTAVNYFTGAFTSFSNLIQTARLVAGGGTCTYKATFGDDLGTVGLVPSTSAAIQIGKTSDDSAIFIGQSGTANLQCIWRRDATPANAYAEIVTHGYNNPLRINTEALTLNTVSNHPVTVGGSTGTVGFFGATPVVKQTLDTSLGDTARITAIENLLADYGLANLIP